MTTKSDAQDKDLAAIYPQPVKFPSGTIEIHVVPMGMDDCVRVYTLARPAFEALAESGTKINTLADFVDIGVREALPVIAEHWPSIKEALAIATKQPEDSIAQMPPGVVLALAAHVFSVNADFFGQTVGSLAAGAQQTAQASGTAGPTH